MKFVLLDCGQCQLWIISINVCHPLEMANKIDDADHILITLQFSPLSKSNARELTITLGFQSAIERADSPVREIICPCKNTMHFIGHLVFSVHTLR